LIGGHSLDQIGDLHVFEAALDVAARVFLPVADENLPETARLRGIEIAAQGKLEDDCTRAASASVSGGAPCARTRSPCPKALKTNADDNKITNKNLRFIFSPLLNSKSSAGAFPPITRRLSKKRDTAREKS
jgi:hypothetical protein